MQIEIEFRFSSRMEIIRHWPYVPRVGDYVEIDCDGWKVQEVCWVDSGRCSVVIYLDHKGS